MTSVFNFGLDLRARSHELHCAGENLIRPAGGTRHLDRYGTSLLAIMYLIAQDEIYQYYHEVNHWSLGSCHSRGR